MGIVRLAKSLRLLKSIKEFSSRETDIKEKISGNRVYMDFVSIVYRIQENVALELNYLLFTFILIKRKIINSDELLSEKLYKLLIKYKDSIQNYKKIYSIFNSITNDTKKNDILNKLIKFITNSFISHFKTHIRSNDILNIYIYKDVVYFIVDMLTYKITDVEYILIAFDGIPSFGKIQEQRQRRYMRFAFNEFKKIMRKKEDIKNTTPLYNARKEYDKDHINVNIRTAIEYVYSMYHDNTLQNDISIGIDLFRKKNNNDMKKPIIEVMDRPYGEGEKILMDKLIIDHKNFSDKSYVFYSPDGDSVILCLNIYIKTKVEKLNVVKMYILEPSRKHNNQTQYVDIPKLYNNIVQHVVKYSHLKIETVKDKDHICSDFIFFINFYGNDFLHQIPTMEISTTIIDLIYIYSRFIRDNEYITDIKNNRTDINFDSMKKFFIVLASYEEYLMLDSYTSELETRNKIFKYFGDIFPFRYLLDYREKIYESKKYIYNSIKNSNTKSYDSIKQMVSDMILHLNEIQTKSGYKYGDIFLKTEAKNIGFYVSKIMTDAEHLLDQSYIFIYNIKLRRNRNEKHMTNIIKEIEKDLIENNKSINIDNIKNSNNNVIRAFSFDYTNIRDIIPHNQMPTTSKDVNIFLLDWKSGKWVDIINSYSYELGYNWKTNKAKKINDEMKRYQYNMLESNNKELNNMISSYLKTISWMIDYYMNTSDKDTKKYISSWSYNYKRSPFITHISEFLHNKSNKNIKSMMFNVYNRSLIKTNNYITHDKHSMYIYPLSKKEISYISKKYQYVFPDMIEYVKITINESNIKSKKRKRLFDCRMCAYLSKCIFKNKMLTYRELCDIDIKK